ncbi:MAG: hypothetical protein M1831_000007 [Alyxoria varia]|nr:MAG: hypothetical protein M1831_000007 [Alyxoria varia]
MHFTPSTLAALASLAATATEAHMLLANPPGWKVNNSPLNGPSGGSGAGDSNYPCKLTSYPKMPRSKIPAGGDYVVKFQGQAVHGGGSCQFALSKDLAPTKKSSFKVVHSVEGGCPARGSAGNAGDNAGAIAKDSYKFKMPSSVPPGDYTFAWTWFNKIGNREMYMNCAPITVTGGGKVKRHDPYTALEQADVADDYYKFNSSITATGDLRRRAAGGLDGLPDLFLANIPDVKCTTKDSADLQFPKPGKSCEKNPGATLAPPVGDAASCYAPLKGGAAPAPAAPAGGSGGAGAGAGAGSYGGGGATSGGAPPAGGDGAGAGSGGASPSAAASAPGASSGSSDSAPSSPPPATGGSSDGQCPAGAQSCPSPGAVVCLDGGNFGLCGANNCATPQKLAAGTTCKGGKIMRRSLIQ